MPSASALTGLPKEVAVPLNANHRSICKYRNIHDPNWLVLRDRLVDLVKRTATTQASLKLRNPIPFWELNISKPPEAQTQLDTPSSSAPTPLITNLNSREMWIRGRRCNICRNRIAPTYPDTVGGYRFRCLDCDNYDLCSICQPTGRTSLNHSTNHPLRKILSTRLISQFDITTIHTENKVDAKIIEDHLGLEHLDPLLLLSPQACHIRFLADNIKSGSYHVIFLVALNFLKRQSGAQHRASEASLRKMQELGVLRAAAGTPSEKFFPARPGGR